MAEEDDMTIIMENQRRKNNIISIMKWIEYINKTVLSYLDKKDKIRRDVRAIIFDDNELARRIPALLVYREILKIHQEHRIDAVEFISEVRKMSDRIGAVDDELAAKVGPIYLNRGVIHYLRDRYSKIKRVKDVHTFLREIYPRFYAEFISLENKQLFNEMNNLFGKKIEEMEYLRRYSREVMSWSNFPEPQRVEYYAQRIRFFLYGGYQDYKGLVTEFEDREILDEIKKRDMIKQLLNYSEQRKFIADRVREVRTGWQEGNWDDFYKFFRNAKRHAKNLVIRFGNVDFAKRILKDRKAFRESPKEWLNALQEMETQISNIDYFETKVLKPTIRELIGIFDGRAKDVEKELTKSLKEFKAYMRNALEDVEKAPKRKARMIVNHVRSKEKQIMSRWIKIRAEFERLEIMLLYYMIRLDNAFNDINTRCADPNMYFRRINGIEERQEAWRRHYLQTINRINIMGTGNIPIAEEMLSLPYVLGAHDKIIKFNDDSLEEEMIMLFSENIPKIMEEAEKASLELDKIIAFINERGLSRLMETKVIPLHPERTYGGIALA